MSNPTKVPNPEDPRVVYHPSAAEREILHAAIADWRAAAAVVKDRERAVQLIFRLISKQQGLPEGAVYSEADHVFVVTSPPSTAT